MKGKIFHPDEANRMLPLVSRIADDIVATYTRIQRALEALEAEKNSHEEDRSSQDSAAEEAHEAQLRRLDEEIARYLDRFQSLIEEIEALGGTVKDYERPCIDFYGEVDGKIVYLCWQRGEESITHWHKLEEGFDKRRALHIASAA